MDLILSGAIILAMAVTILCIVLHKGSQSEHDDDYDRYLNEDNDHIHYDKTAIRYHKGIWKKDNND